MRLEASMRELSIVLALIAASWAVLVFVPALAAFHAITGGFPA